MPRWQEPTPAVQGRPMVHPSPQSQASAAPPPIIYDTTPSRLPMWRQRAKNY